MKITFTGSLIFRIIALIIIDAFAIQLSLGLSTFSILLSIGIVITTILLNIVFLFDRFYPWRWSAPGLALMALLVLYPVLSTAYVAFTNLSDGHNLTREQALEQLLSDKDTAFYKPENAITYKWTAYLSADAASRPTTDNDYVFWLVQPDGKAFVGSASKGIVDEAGAEAVYGKLGDKDSTGIPTSIGNFNRLPATQLFSKLKAIQGIVITDQQYQVRFTSITAAPQLVAKYTYDTSAKTLTDNETGKVYHEERGAFVRTAESGEKETLTPGWSVPIGLDNFLRTVTDENVRGPFFRVFAWTIIFAVGSVLMTFSLGLAFALVLNSPDLPFRGLFRSVLILPYAIPGFIGALIWAGLFNPIFGPINGVLKSLFGISPGWFSDPTLAKVVILLVNLWIGYPYMMLITMGALQSIPSDIYEASVIDGANPRQQFWRITLPLLLVAVAPLLIGSFAYNFNNFSIIELITKGGPPASALTPAGHTDILISYTYRLAFGGAKGADYGFASAIAVFIFAIVAGITIVNFRISRQLEQVYD